MSILSIQSQMQDMPDRASLSLKTVPHAFDIRPAILDDSRELNRLWRQLDIYHYVQDPVHFPAIKSSEPARSIDYIDGLINRHDQTLLVAEKCDSEADAQETGSERALLGLASVCLKTLSPNAIFPARVLFELDNLIVDQNARRMGVAKALCEAACNWAKGHGAQEMALNVYDFNSPARAFYEAMGFLPNKTQMTRPLL